MSRVPGRSYLAGLSLLTDSTISLSVTPDKYFYPYLCLPKTALKGIPNYQVKVTKRPWNVFTSNAIYETIVFILSPCFCQFTD